MRAVRATLLLGFSTLLLGSIPTSCNTSAVGVDECRRIENARCEAAVRCPGEFDVSSVSACKRFYRDHCLHGLAVSSVPSKPDVDDCIATIGALADCARQKGETSQVTQCGSLTSTDPDVKTVCELMRKPQASPDCSFLVPVSQDGTGGSGGENTGGTGNTSGEAGAAGAT